MSLLVPEIVALLLIDAITLGLLTVAVPTAVQVWLRWDGDATTESQYRLERRASLAATVTGFALLAKLPAAALCVAGLDAMADRIDGAMCAVGVLDSGPSGGASLALRVGVLFLLLWWRALHRRDVETAGAPHTRATHGLLLLVFAALVLELALSWAFFAGLRVDRVATCCAAAFSTASDGALPLLAHAPPVPLTAALLVAAVAALATTALRRPYLSALAHAALLGLGLTYVVAVTSPYVYELPTHRCPFCVTKPEYGYVGVVLYGALFLGAARGMAPGILRAVTGTAGDRRHARLTIALDVLFVALALGIPLAYRLRTGAWL